MTMYHIPDITGVNPDYLQANIPAYFRRNGMKYVFENSPIFEDSLVITLTDGTARTFVKDTHWKVNADDIDDTAMGRAFLQNPAFTKTLLKSITIISAEYINLKVAMTYQEFYLTNPGRTFDDGSPLELTPDLVKTLVTGLGDVRQQVARVTSPTASNNTVPKLLPFDVNCELSSNVIVDEVIPVNTIAGAKVIRLANGAFFANSLTIKLGNTTLSSASDYTPIVLSPLTAQSSNKSGIYHCILINGEVAGDLTIGYHALGGEVQIADINAVYEKMLAISNYLDEEIFITSSTITETPSFRAMNARLNYLEDTMRRILTGSPTYGDSSGNNAVTRPIATVDADFHWFTIASLYMVQGSSDIIRADQFKGRIYLPTAKVSMAFTVDVNIDQDTNPVHVTTDSLVFDPGYVLFTTLSVNAPLYPMIRVVWNNSSETYSGAMLQVGFPVPSLADQMVVEDFSSAESCWILSRLNEFVTGQTVVNVSGPSDNGFTLPDGVSVWSDASGISYATTVVPDYSEGYLAYAGAAVTVEDLNTVTDTSGSFTISLPTYFPLASCKTLLVTMMSADGDTVYDIDIPLVGNVGTVKQGRRNFCDSDNEAMCMIARVTKDNYNNMVIGLNISEIALPLQAGTPSAQTDIVRYIRVKV